MVLYMCVTSSTPFWIDVTVTPIVFETIFLRTDYNQNFLKQTFEFWTQPQDSIYMYRKCHHFSYRLKFGSVQFYGALYT